jgi:uncharacterized membrane protein
MSFGAYPDREMPTQSSIDGVFDARSCGRAASAEGAPMRITKAVTIFRPLKDVFDFWVNDAHASPLSQQLRVVSRGDQGSWTVKAPDEPASWDVTLTAHSNSTLVSWREIAEDRDSCCSGSVRFVAAPGDRGTEVHVELEHEQGRGGAMLAKLVGADPQAAVEEDLVRMKQMMETGEVLKAEAAWKKREPRSKRTRRTPKRIMAGADR